MIDSAEPRALRDTERWFTRRGLPMFVEDYSSHTDVWTRTLPALVVLFVLVLPPPTSVRLRVLIDDVDGSVQVGLDADPLALLTVGLVLLVLVGAYAGWNLAHRRRAFARPERVGVGLLAAFVLVPTALSAVMSRDLAEAAWTAVSALVLLGLVYLITRYALLALTWWALKWTLHRVGELVRLTTRVLPLLLLVVTFLFLSTELWQVAGTMDARLLWGSLAVFGVLGLGVMVSRVGEETSRVDTTADRAEVLAAAAGTPLASVAADLADLDLPVALSRRQRWNVALVLIVAQSVQVTLIGVVVWAFFVVFGAVAVGIDVQQSWLGHLDTVEPLVDLGLDHGITRESLRVATFLAGFAGFYVTVVATGDRVYREHFLDQIGEHVRASLAVRRAYLAARRRQGLPAPAPDRGEPTPDPAASTG